MDQERRGKNAHLFDHFFEFSLPPSGFLLTLPIPDYPRLELLELRLVLLQRFLDPVPSFVLGSPRSPCFAQNCAAKGALAFCPDYRTIFEGKESH